MISYLNFSEFCPVSHAWLQIQVAIDSVIVEFLQLDSFLLRKEVLVNPVKDVQEGNTLV
jgi:hypothetical protein